MGAGRAQDAVLQMRAAVASAEAISLPRDRIVISCKVSAVQDLIAVYGELATRTDHASGLRVDVVPDASGLPRPRDIRAYWPAGWPSRKAATNRFSW